MSELKKQFEHKNYTSEDFERTITTAMKVFKLSQKKALAHLMLHMTMNGSVEDFKNYINYYIEKQKERVNSLDQFKLKNEECKGCDYNPEEDCSEGCMKLKYYEELEKER